MMRTEVVTSRPAVAPGLLLAASKDPDAKLVFLAGADDGNGTQLAVKVPVTSCAGAAVEAEGRALVALRRLPLDRELAATVPRLVRMVRWEQLPVLVTTAVPGRSMRVAYHEWRHTARPRLVARDLELAGGWLNRLQYCTERAPEPCGWAQETLDGLRGRWDGHPDLPAAVLRLQDAARRLEPLSLPVTAVHGDYWFGNVLVDHGRVSGVVDWEAGQDRGCPLRDLARFALSYALYLDRHTSLGRPVAGHRGLRRVGFGVGIAYGLLGTGWFAAGIRDFLGDGLARLGGPRSAWYATALTGIGEVAVQANQDAFAEDHLRLLARLPEDRAAR